MTYDACWTRDWPTLEGFYWATYRLQGPIIVRLFRSVLSGEYICDMSPGILVFGEDSARINLMFWSESIVPPKRSWPVREETP